jgi:hypothetical protein
VIVVVVVVVVVVVFVVVVLRGVGGDVYYTYLFDILGYYLLLRIL